MSFFVTAIAYYPDDTEKRYDKPYKRTNTFGHFQYISDAVRAVEHNDGGMDECLYNYLVIEEIGYGIYAGICNWEPDNPKQYEWWYQWEHPDGQEGHWVKMDKPDWSKGFLNWSVG